MVNFLTGIIMVKVVLYGPFTKRLSDKCLPAWTLLSLTLSYHILSHQNLLLVSTFNPVSTYRIGLSVLLMFLSGKILDGFHAQLTRIIR